MNINPKQIGELLLHERLGEYGPEGIGEDLDWFRNNWRIVRGLRSGEIRLTQFPCEIICPELIPRHGKDKQWEVIEDNFPAIRSVADLDFIPLLREDQPSLTGKEMRQKAVDDNTNHGLCDAKFVLVHQEEVPEAVHDKVIIFAGTLLSNLASSFFVPCLRFNAGRLILVWTWLGDVSFDSLCVLPRGRSERPLGSLKTSVVRHGFSALAD
ncbi:MAG: hypothetical protein Q7K35_04310 [bacterium]|nr:hypothetical protein [bacterium]